MSEVVAGLPCEKCGKGVGASSRLAPGSGYKITARYAAPSKD